jgi:hypothetical protein
MSSALPRMPHAFRSASGSPTRWAFWPSASASIGWICGSSRRPFRRPPALWRLLRETAVEKKMENVPKQVAGEVTRAILSGGAYPRSLLANVIMRIRADGEVSGVRAAIIKAVLVRLGRIERHEREDHRTATTSSPLRRQDGNPNGDPDAGNLPRARSRDQPGAGDGRLPQAKGAELRRSREGRSHHPSRSTSREGRPESSSTSVPTRRSAKRSSTPEDKKRKGGEARPERATGCARTSSTCALSAR